MAKEKTSKTKKVTKVVKVAKVAKATKATKAKKTVSKAKYWEGVGRRKTASARVRIWTRGGKEFLVNEKEVKDYFPLANIIKVAIAPLETLKLLPKFKVSARVKGGGVNAQAEAVRHGLSRALVKFNPNFRKRLKKAGFLTRDSRMKERKKFGLKRARRAPQWQKR